MEIDWGRDQRELRLISRSQTCSALFIAPPLLPAQRSEARRPPPLPSPQPRRVSRLLLRSSNPNSRTQRSAGHRSEGRKASRPVMELGGGSEVPAHPPPHAPAWAVPSAANASVSVCLGLRSPRRLPLNLFVEFPDANLLFFFPCRFCINTNLLNFQSFCWNLRLILWAALVRSC